MLGEILRTLPEYLKTRLEQFGYNFHQYTARVPSDTDATTDGNMITDSSVAADANIATDENVTIDKNVTTNGNMIADSNLITDESMATDENVTLDENVTVDENATTDGTWKLDIIFYYYNLGILWPRDAACNQRNCKNKMF